MIVECVGAPGSGKTTTLKVFYNGNRGFVHSLRPRFYLDGGTWGGLVDRLHLEIIGELASQGEPSQNESVKTKLSYEQLDQLVIRLHQCRHYLGMGGLVVEEEGLFKTFPEMMHACLHNRPNIGPILLKNRAFVIFETDPFFQAKMIKERKLGRAWSKKRRHQVEQRYDENLPKRLLRYSETLAVWRGLKAKFDDWGAAYIVIDPADGVSSNAEKIARFLIDLSAPRRLRVETR